MVDIDVLAEDRRMAERFRNADSVCERVSMFSPPIEAMASPEDVNPIGTIEVIRQSYREIGEEAMRIASGDGIIMIHTTEGENVQDILSEGFKTGTYLNMSRRTPRIGKVFFWIHTRDVNTHAGINGHGIVCVANKEDILVSHYGGFGMFEDGVIDKDDYANNHIVTGKEYIECLRTQDAPDDGHDITTLLGEING